MTLAKIHVSVIIALHNQASMIKEAIESVLSQTYKNLEIIVVDDGSTDNAKDELSSLIKEGKIRYIYQNNKGLAAARNTGTKAALGEYVKFLDSDDFLYPEQIERQINDIKDDTNTISLTDHYDLRPNGEMVPRYIFVERKERQLAWMIKSNYTVVHAILIPKKLIEEAGYFDETLTAGEDWDLWIRLLKNGCVIKHLSFIGCSYRISVDSMSADRIKMFRQKAKILEKTNTWALKEKSLSDYMKDSLLIANVNLIEEGIARKINLGDLLPNTFIMTEKLFSGRKKGLLKRLFTFIGGKKYIQMRYMSKKMKDPSYEYKLLNEVNHHRYGNFLQKLGKRVSKPQQYKNIVLMYHRVANLNFDPWHLAVSPENFDAQMQIIKKYGRSVSIGEAAQNYQKFSIGHKNIVVTFDDGYADNFQYAKPILEKYQIPATFYVVSGAVDSPDEFWWDELEGIILGHAILPDKFEMSIEGILFRWPINQTANADNVAQIPPNNMIVSKTQLYYILWHILNYLPATPKKDYLKKIAQWAKSKQRPRTNYLPLSKDQLQIISQSPLFEIGAHTRNHLALPELPQSLQWEEINGCKEDLEKIINKPIRNFSYPHGKYNKNTVDILKNLHFTSACTVDGEVFNENLGVYSMPRFTVFNWDAPTFKEKLSTWIKS